MPVIILRTTFKSTLKGDVIGYIEFVSNDKAVLSAPLIAIESVEAKGFFGRIWARIVLDNEPVFQAQMTDIPAISGF